MKEISATGMKRDQNGKWSTELQYRILSGMIDSDGHVYEYFGTQTKIVSGSTHRRIRDISANLRIKATYRAEDAT